MTKSKLKRKYLQILSALAIEELFGLPTFTDTERIYYFTLNPKEMAIMNSLIVYALQCIGFLDIKKELAKKSM